MHVFPCVPRGKTPAVTHGCKAATCDPDLIKHWWRLEPAYNIAIATGAQSRIFVLDIDDSSAESELSKLESEHDPLPQTVESITARGRHLYFEWPDRPVRNSVGKLGPGLDIRAAGGYILAPPSAHPTGRRYCWSVDSAATFAPAPQWLVDRIAEPTKSNGWKPSVLPSEWRTLIAGVDEGQRDNSVARLCGYLLHHDLDPFVVLEMLQLWNTRCRPPLPPKDVERIVDSICGRELKRRGGHAG
jgi:hypothetical protein